jgi:hypothetical protein
LCIAGVGVAQGYWDRAELTRQRFVDHPELGRCYRTGDIASWRADGTIELHGRDDRQVKLRGYRIELPEIEHALAQHPLVDAAAVTVRTGGSDAADCLVAFVESPGVRLEDLWQHALGRLPTYCAPERIVVLPRLPTTANGKVDLPALASWPLPATARANVADDSPGTAAEPDEVARDLIGLWCDLLGTANATEHTNFFLSGGNSLLALRLVAAVKRRTGVPLTLMTVFNAPTPARLAAAVRRS